MKPWTAEELNTLHTYYPTVPTSDVADMLGRSVSAVHTMACRLQLRKQVFWCDEKVAWLERNYPYLGPAYCAQHFGVTLDSIKSIAYRNGLYVTPQIRNNPRLWTDWDKKLLVGVVQSIAKHLDCSPQEVASRLNTMETRHAKGEDWRL